MILLKNSQQIFQQICHRQASQVYTRITTQHLLDILTQNRTV